METMSGRMKALFGLQVFVLAIFLLLTGAGTAIGAGEDVRQDIITRSPWADIRAYGAVGDGTTDDSTAINRALQDSRFVFVPPGFDFYVGAATIRVPADTVLFGSGRASRITSDTTGHAVEVGTPGKAITDVSVHGLYISAPKASAVFYVTGARRSEFFDLVLNDASSGIGLYIHAETGSGVYRSSFRDIYSSGTRNPFRFEGDGDGSRKPRVNLCTFENLIAPSILEGGTGFDVTDASGNVFISCGAESMARNVTGFRFSGCQRTSLVGGWSENRGHGSADLNMAGQTNDYGVAFLGFRYGRSVVDEDSIAITNVIRKNARNGSTPVMESFVRGDTRERFRLLPSGKMEWGPGTGPTDTSLYRDVSGSLKTGGVFTADNLKRGPGSPEGSVPGNTGDIYIRIDGGKGTTFYVKESGSPWTVTGWAAK